MIYSLNCIANPGSRMAVFPAPSLANEILSRMKYFVGMFAMGSVKIPLLPTCIAKNNKRIWVKFISTRMIKVKMCVYYGDFRSRN